MYSSDNLVYLLEARPHEFLAPDDRSDFTREWVHPYKEIFPASETIHEDMVYYFVLRVPVFGAFCQRSLGHFRA